jgi:putative DNA primase/helicase
MQDVHSGVSFTDVADANQETGQQPTTEKGNSSKVTRNSVITVVRDPRHPLGKKFTLNSDGTITKRAAVAIAIGIAVMHVVNTIKELAALLKQVGNDPHAAVINASFSGIEVGEEFLILSEREIERRTGIPKADRDRQQGIHNITYNGQDYKGVGRFKANVKPSCWQYFDRDIDQYTPEMFAQQNFTEWHSTLSEIVPGLADVSWCRTGSTSARVLHDGKPVGGGNGHLWLWVSDPEDIERFRTAILINAAKANLTWLKPRYSRKDPGTVVGHSLTTIIDPSVFTPGRLTFIGQPVVGGGLTVEPLSTSIHIGMKSSVDTSMVVLPNEQNIREITRKAGTVMEVTQDGSGLRITANDLTMQTELETEDQGVLTVRELVEQGISGKIRCQTPFRDSSSFAAFVSTGKDGKPFVHDVGTGITHWLDDAETDDFQLVRAKGFVKELSERVKDDCGAPLEPESVAALAEIKKRNAPEFARIRKDLKKVNQDVSLTELDAAIKGITLETHHGYATDIISRLTVGEWPPKAYEGDLYRLGPDNLWIKYPFESIRKIVAETHDGKPNCQRNSDYSGIASHVIMLASDDTFFADAPVGLATPDGFYQIRDNELFVEPLFPDHRQRVKIDVTPKEEETPRFNAFLHETFQSDTEEEEKQQLILVQEIIGAIMVGIMAVYQKAVLFYDKYGRAGKGTLERIIAQLVPRPYITAVSPFQWDGEYYRASLIGSRFNTVGELPESKPIPAAVFKSVTGGDFQTGRHPSGRPITFKNSAAHLFMSNHLINTPDHSEAFFSRWLLVEFLNSRLRTGLPLDPGLADRIIKHELPGIAYWALIGAKRLMENDEFSQSAVHDRLMAKWRRSTNSLEEFIFESCDLVDQKEYIRRSEFYRKYKEWCAENGRRPFAVGKVKDMIAYNIGLGIMPTVLNGYEIFRGVMLKEDSSRGLNPQFEKQCNEVLK